MTLSRLSTGALLVCLALTACRASFAQGGATPTPAPSATSSAPAALAVVPADQRERWETRPELQRHFAELGTAGTIAVLDTRAHR